MRRIRDVQELKACIQRCRRADLDRLIKLTNLPRGGLKQDIQMRLISYLEQDPSTEFISALHELRTLMYGATNIQFSRQRNGNSNPPYSSDDPPASLLYLTAAANRSLELLENNTGPHPYLSSSKTNYGCQKDQSFCNLPTSQSHPNSTSVVQQSSFSGVNIAKEREQQFQNEDSFNQLMHRSSLSVNPMINPSVWAAWTSANKLLPEHQSAANSQLCSSQSPQTSFSNFHSCSRTAATSSLSTSSSSNMTVVNSSLSKYSECTQSTVGAPCSESKIATITYKIGPLITLAGANGSFRLPAVLPEFHFMESPFFKLLDVLLPPQVILPAHIGFATGRRSYDRSLALRFTSDQAETITYHCWRGADERMEFGVQVIMRFGRLNPQACENLVQTYELTGSRKSGSFSLNKPIKIPLVEDSLPVHLMIQVNGRSVQLPPLLPSNRPGMDGRRNPRPINITQSLHVSPTVPNYIKLTWTHDYTSFTYNVVGIYLMRRRSPKQLCDLLHSTSLQNANVMRMEIIKKLSPSGNFTSGSAVHNQSHSAAHTDDDDDLVMPNTLPVQLLCPLSKCRIEVPVRGRNCRHVQCYDATTYLIINERKPTWNCPVCDGKATYGDLIIDGLFLEILSSKRSQDLDEIIFHADGSWSAIGEDMAHKKSENNTNSNITESPPCRDYNQRYGLLESPYTSHITPNSIISATDSVGSSSFRHSFNTLSPTNSVNSSSNQHTSCVSQLSESPALTVRSSRVAPMIRNEISNITGSNTPAYHMSVSKQTSQDKEQNQQTGQEPSSLTIDLTLSDDENEQQNKSVQNIISNSRIPITDTNSSARLVNAVAPLPSSLSPQFPPSEFSQSTLCSENTPQFPLSSSMTSKQSSTSLSNVSYVERCNQTSTVPTVHPLESNLIQSTYVSRSIETPNYPGTVTSSNPKHFPSAGDRDLTKRSYNDSIHSSTQIDVPVSLSSVSLVGSKRGISSEQDFPLLNSHEVANQPLTSIETRSGLTIHSVSSLSNESRHCTLAPVKIPRNEITHNEFPGSFTTCYQGPCSNNATINNNSNNNAKRSTSSPAFSDSYKHHNNASRQQQVQGYHNRPSTSFYADQSSNRSYHNENSSNGNTRYSYHNPNESNSINRAYGCYPSSRNVHYPTTDSTAINPHGRQTSCNVRNPYSCYEPHYRNSPSNPSIRDVLQYNSHQMKSSELSNSKYYSNSLDSRRGFH